MAGESIIYHGDSYELTEDDYVFEFAFNSALAHLFERAHYAKITGVKHDNPDGSSRAKALAECEEFHRLSLIPEPDNPYDRHAIAIYTEADVQVGYLEAVQAQDIEPGMRRRGDRWAGVFRHALTHSGEVVGAVFLLCKYK